MTMQISKLISATLVLTTTMLTGGNAIAQTLTSPPTQLETIPQLVDRAFFQDSGDYYHNRSIKRQFQLIFGTDTKLGAAFPELEIERDGKLLNVLYHDLLFQQTSTDPYLRTVDIPSPFNTSIRSLSSNRVPRILG
ncbi:MAG TPA: hypothetical protein V6C58_17645, partial [Allocoleopsis sp.]